MFFFVVFFLQSLSLLIAINHLNINKTTVNGILKIEQPSGEPVVNMTFYLYNDIDLNTWITDSNGMTNITVPSNSNFILKGINRPDFQDLYIYGWAGSIDFQYTTFMGTKTQALLFAKIINIPYNESNGYVVVGMDELIDPKKGLTPSNLIPAIGSKSYLFY